MKLLKEQGFRFNSKESTLIDIATGKTISTVSVINPRHLYEWADMDYHEAWMANGGILQEDMTSILRSAPQTGGKGYYVSTNPFDSVTYGDALTVFTPSRPLVVVHGSYDYHDTKLAFRLQKAGIDANLYTTTWLAFLSHKQLVIDNGPIQDPAWYSPEALIQWNRIPNLKKSHVYHRLPKDNVLYLADNLVKGEPLSDKQLEILSGAARFHALPIVARQPLLKAQLESLSKNPSSVIFSSFFDMYRSLKNDQTAISDFADQTTPAKQKIYENILYDFDLKTLYLLSKGQEIKDISSLEHIKEISANNMRARRKMDPKKIADFDGYIGALEKLLGHSVKFRNEDVFMSSELVKSRDFTIEIQPSHSADLTKNGLLSINDLGPNKKNGAQKLEVTYLSFEKLSQMAHRLPLSPALIKFFQTVKVPGKGRPLTPQMKRNYTLAMKELTIGLFSDSKAQTMIIREMYRGMPVHVDINSLYKAFMAIHPFEDGNGRAGRLFYEVLRHDSAPKQMLVPIFDVDLFANALTMAEQQSYGRPIQIFLAQAKNDADFFQRVQIAMDLLRKKEPRLLKLFPELEEPLQQ